VKILGFELRRVRQPPINPRLVTAVAKALNTPSGHWTTILDAYPGYWQQDTSIELNSVLTFGAVFACIRLISSDIGKLRIKLMVQNGGLWQETTRPSYSPVLRKPNSTQTRIKFIEQWMQSKLIYGYTYVLKMRNRDGNVIAMRVLDPTRVTPLVSDQGEVFYKLRRDDLATIATEVTVPAREIIHDVHMTPEHPLLGVSPIGACGLAATQGLKIQGNSAKLFTNMSRPAGILTAPGAISDATASRIKTSWDTNYGGDNYGKTAVLGDGLEYKAIATTAVDAQLIEQLQWTAEDVCRAFGVPGYKIGVGAMPAYNNIEALDQAYYSQTLQEFIECIESLLDEGLEMPESLGTEFDLDGLLRMDSMTQALVDKEEMGAGILAPDEARAKRGRSPVPGGKYPYMQQQNYSLEALAKRDAQPDPFGTAKPTPAPTPPADQPVTMAMSDLLKLSLSDVAV
jgi:HK97 family phage portal protein